MVKKTETYAQCRLERKLGDGSVTCHVSWIPSKFAKVGTVLKLKDRDTEVWTDGWVVKEKWTVRDAASVEQHERDHVHQREASDI